MTTSEVDVLVTQRDNDVIYQCHGTNEQLGQTVVDTITLTVMCTLFTVSLPQSHLQNAWSVSATAGSLCKIFKQLCYVSPVLLNYIIVIST